MPWSPLEAVCGEPMGRLELRDLLGHCAFVGSDPRGGREPGPHLAAARVLEVHLQDVSLALGKVQRLAHPHTQYLIWWAIDFYGVREC